jgi:hypothetical protein
VVLALLLPWRLQSRAATDPPPPRSALRLARWLLLRLMFSSAVVKLASGDPAWRNLTALQFHYETQPLPIWTAWYAHHLPPAFQSFSAAVMFSIEGLAPWCVLLPRRPRIAAAASIVGLQLLIAATGNYGIFNALAIALCLVYVDDGFWPKWVRRLAGFETAPDGALARPARGRAHRLVRRPLAIALVLLSVVPLWSALRLPVAPLGPLRVAYVLAQPFRVVNPYGLFAVMTTTRPEIVIEGSDDGQVWRAYEFPFKAGDPNRRPGFVAPHMPRLDWQMWFAALGDWRGETWVFYFLDRLLHGEPRVLALLARNPFPDHPPRFVRTVRYLYRFTTAAERRRTGAWWTRELEGAWAPALTLKDGRLAPMVEPAP